MESRQHRRIINYGFQPLANDDAITARAAKNWVLLKPWPTVGPRKKALGFRGPYAKTFGPNKRQNCSQLTIAL